MYGLRLARTQRESSCAALAHNWLVCGQRLINARSNSICDAYFLCFRGRNIDFKNKLSLSCVQLTSGLMALLQLCVRCGAGARAAISRDKANCKWTSEKGIKPPPPPLLPSTAHRLWQLDYTLIDCEPPFSTYTHTREDAALSAGLCAARCHCSDKSLRGAHPGKRIAGRTMWSTCTENWWACHRHRRSTCKMLYFGWLLMEREELRQPRRTADIGRLTLPFLRCALSGAPCNPTWRSSATDFCATVFCAMRDHSIKGKRSGLGLHCIYS